MNRLLSIQDRLAYARRMLSRRYKQLAVLTVLILLGIGLCGTDKETRGAFGGERSLWGAVLLAPSILLWFAAGLDTGALQIAERRILREALIGDNDKDTP